MAREDLGVLDRRKGVLGVRVYYLHDGSMEMVYFTNLPSKLPQCRQLYGIGFTFSQRRMLPRGISKGFRNRDSPMIPKNGTKIVMLVVMHGGNFVDCCWFQKHVKQMVNINVEEQQL